MECVLSVVLFVFVTKLFVWCAFVIQIHRYYRASGHTINEAMEEGVAGAAKNKHVRSAVKTTVKTGVKTAMDSQRE